MAYESGNALSAANLVVAIQIFAQANGWTLTGDVLSKDGCYVQITAPSSTEVHIRGARNGNFAGVDLCPRLSRICLDPWPANATFHLAAFAAPDTIWCTVNWNTTDFAHLGFGTIQKYGTWAGGQWFHAQHNLGIGSTGPGTRNTECFVYIDGSGTAYQHSVPNNCGLFWSQQDKDTFAGRDIQQKVSHLHCELRGEVWAAASNNDRTDLNTIHCPTVISPIQKRNPNAFNGQTILTPFQLFLQNTDGHYMPIGHVGHLRFVKMTNYNAGDVITLGPDRWKLYPWSRLDPTKPDGDIPGADQAYSAGMLGVAVRYDGA